MRDDQIEEVKQYLLSVGEDGALDAIIEIERRLANLHSHMMARSDKENLYNKVLYYGEIQRRIGNDRPTSKYDHAESRDTLREIKDIIGD